MIEAYLPAQLSDDEVSGIVAVSDLTSSARPVRRQWVR